MSVDANEEVTVAIWAVAGLTALSGVVAQVRMYETHPVTRNLGRP